MRIKLFSCSDNILLEELVNDFLADKSIRIVSLKIAEGVSEKTVMVVYTTNSDEWDMGL